MGACVYNEVRQQRLFLELGDGSGFELAAMLAVEWC